MSTTPTSAAGQAGGAVTIGGKDRLIERVSARKASRALAILRQLSREAPELQRALADFRREYEATNVIELDRAAARLRFPPRAALNADGEPVLDANGDVILIPSAVDRLTEEDWERSGHVLKVPASPSGAEVVAALFDRALELAESHVYRLLALFLMSNADVKAYRRDGSLDDRLAQEADDLLDDAMADEVMALAVVAGEVVEDQFRTKAAELGGRLGNALRLVGMEWTPPTSAPTPSTSRPTSSTPSPAPTDGPPTTSSTPPTTSSSPSAPDSAATPSERTPSASAPSTAPTASPTTSPPATTPAAA